MYWLVLCVNLTQAGAFTEKRASGEEIPPRDPAVRHFVGGAIPGLVVLGSTRKQAEQVRGS